MTANDDLNEDWIKTLAWDLPFSNLQGLLEWMHVDKLPPDEQRGPVEHFMSLPAWEAAPGLLKEQTQQWLHSSAG